MENLRLRDDGHHTRGSQSTRFEDGHFQMIDLLEIGNVGTVQEKLKEAHAVISAEQESQGYQGDQQIQGKRQPKLTEKGREYHLSTLENKHAMLVSRLLSTQTISGLTTLIKKCSASNTKCITG